MKTILLCICGLAMLAGCVNGNATAIYRDGHTETFRVSSCLGTDTKAWLYCTSYGKQRVFLGRSMVPERVVYHADVISYPGADLCSEMGWLCGDKP